MRLEIAKNPVYNLIEETKIETVGGALYQAQDLELGRTVAVKCVNIQGSDRAERNRNYQKAQAEVQALVRLSDGDVNVPTVFATHYDEENGTYYIVMEWIRGETLTKRMHCPQWQFLRWMGELCEILEHMESRKLYHKDIKPDNIMITKANKLWLIDFNISMSTSNLMEGTLHYKAPEMSPNSRYAGREKVDMFAIGVMLYEYYTGAVPVRTVDYAKNRLRGPQVWDVFVEPKQKNPEVSDRMNAIIIKCMKMDPKERYSSISQLKYDLRKEADELRGKGKRT